MKSENAIEKIYQENPARQPRHAEARAVFTRKVLVGQLRAKAGVMRAHQLHVVRLLRLVDAPVAGLPAIASVPHAAGV
ncbi:MAG: hypothetical protein BGO13_14250 [Burkholderiales bacterium 66-5]|uniref:hypothetical protein n=1 Tax=Comamonas badia TaxID=265291 RepID=UPI00092BBB36|nr:hypothetical protein [Comamonas badia]OJU89112.1 MAG: hypothetical protein BGO13_14250 [Burkholderiales bacterium 66-5]